MENRGAPGASPGGRENTNALASRAREGDRAAFDAAYRRFAPALYLWSRLRVTDSLRSRLDPEDLVSEVTLRALQGFDAWDSAKGDFRAWLFGIARNVLRKALEFAAREPGLAGGTLARATANLAALPAETTSITRAVARDESLHRFANLIDALPAEDRKLLTLRGLEGMAHEHVATLLALTPDATAKRWQRLRERLATEPAWLEIVAA